MQHEMRLHVQQLLQILSKEQQVKIYLFRIEILRGHFRDRILNSCNILLITISFHPIQKQQLFYTALREQYYHIILY